MVNQNYLYINECKDVDGYPSMTDAAAKGWVNTGNVIPNSVQAYYCEFANNPLYPYLISPSTVGGNDASPIGDSIWCTSSQNCVLGGGVCVKMPYAGSLSFDAMESITVSSIYIGSRYIV